MERRTFLCWVVTGLWGPGCGPNSPTTAPKAAKYPLYGATEAALFGDTIAPDFLGAERRVPVGEDPYLVLRVAAADSVLAARVSTVNRDSLGEAGPHYSLRVVPLGQVLSGQTEGDALTLLVPPSSASYSWVRALEAALVGRPLILFMKRYNDAGSARIHWHLEPDSLPVRMAVERAKLSREVRP